MNRIETKEDLVNAFKNCMLNAEGVLLDNKKKYAEITSDGSEPMVCWSLNGNWYIEGELYDELNVFEQRKVISNLAPGDFFLIPPSIPVGLFLYARSDFGGDCFICPLKSLLSAIDSPEILHLIGNKISDSIIYLFEFEKEYLKPSLRRPIDFEPNVESKLSSQKMGLSGESTFWMPKKDFTLHPPIRGAKKFLPEYLLMHPGCAFENKSAESISFKTFSNDNFFSNPDIHSHITNQISFQWNELVARWTDHFKKTRKMAIEHSSRNDIYSQSLKGKMLNLLSGKKSYLPETTNHALRSAFYLINKNGWLPSIPSNTEFEDPAELFNKIADSSGLIIRESRLRGKWWLRDSGSFILLDKNNNSYVLSFEKGKYIIWNPEKGQSCKLSESMRSELNKNAIYLFKQLPNQPLTLFDLVFFEVHSVRFEILMVLLLATISSGLVAILPILSAFVINDLLPSALTGLLAIVCGGLVLVGLFQTVFTWFDTMIMTRINYRLSLASTAALWHRVLHFPSRFLGQHASGDIAMRMGTCLGMQEFFRTIAQRLVTMTFQIVTSLGVLFWVSFELGVGSLVFGLVAVTAALAFTYWQIRAFMAGEKSLGIVNSYILELYSGIHKVKAAGVESECLQQWAERYSRLRKKLLASQKVRILHSTFQTSWLTLSTAFVYWMIVSLGENELEPAMFIAFLGAFAIFSMNLSGLCNILILSGIQIPMFKFIKPLLDTTPDCKVDLMIPDKINGNLKVDNVSFYYPSQDTAAIQQANLFIRQGSFVVVAGGSGSGKSTLGRLLSGLDHPSSGHVFIDDYELHTLDPTALRKNIAVVPQDFRLINGSLFENIKGAIDASLDEVIAAAKAACIWDDISELPMKLHTITGTQFGAFSGGQIQRIAIARALIRKPRVLIMDEATSALDNELQAKIIYNVKAMNCTVVFIAHRLKIAKDADQILVLDNGQCVERGTHDELLGLNKFYAKMWSALS